MSGLGIVIMASGFSHRFGSSNKLLMPFKEKTIIECLVDSVVDGNVSQMIRLVTQYDLIIDLFKDKIPILKVIKNDRASIGISGSIQLGIKSLENANGYMFISGDQVLLKSETIRQLGKVFEKNPESIIIPVYNGVYGGPKIFPSSLKEELLSLNGDYGGRHLIKKYKESVIELAIEDCLENWDIDTYEDYNEIKARFE